MERPSPYSIHELFLLNLCLQLFDGLATYYGVGLGWQEGNLLLRNLMEGWGVGWAIVGFKTEACTMLLVLYRLHKCSLSATALVFTAACYFLFSFIPWLFGLLLLLLPL